MPTPCAVGILCKWVFNFIHVVGSALAHHNPSTPDPNDDHFTWTIRINNAFSTLAFVMRSKTLFFMNPNFFILDVCI